MERKLSPDSSSSIIVDKKGIQVLSLLEEHCLFGSGVQDTDIVMDPGTNRPKSLVSLHMFWGQAASPLKRHFQHHY
jgi:hypothetical protein